MKSKKQMMIILIILISIMSITLVFLKILNNNKLSTVKMVQYEISNIHKEKKKIKMDDKNDMSKFNNYIKQIKPLSANEQVDLIIFEEVIIENKFHKIIVQLSEEGYCNYYDKTKKIGYMSKMPDGMIDWVKEKLNEN